VGDDWVSDRHPVLVVDVSGGMRNSKDRVDAALRVFRGLGYDNIRVIAFDAQVKFDGPVNDIKDMDKVRGGCGTSIKPVFERLDIEKVHVFLMSDGLIPDYPEEDPCPVTPMYEDVMEFLDGLSEIKR